MRFVQVLTTIALLCACPALAAGQAQDARYADEIRKHTTRPEFLPPLVDHLPESDTVPSPLDFLGYVPGTPGKLTYAKDVHAYLRALAEKSDHVEVFTLGTSEEGREMLLVAIADAATVRDLPRYKEINRRLADPRTLKPEEAADLLARGKPMYWLTGGLHSPETGSPEMLMELAYRLAVEDSPAIRAIRENVITLITPVLEVDGRERMLDLIRWWQEHPKVGLPPLVYWGHYVAHDNNRDAVGMALALTRNVLTGWLDWHPQVLHDLHESIPFLYVSTGTGPYNAWLDPLAVDTWKTMAQHDVSHLTRLGMPGVWSHGFYDGWAPTYLFYVAHGHNGIGRFYETFGNSTPDTRERRVDAASERAWYRPNPPYPVVTWSLRNNINYQESGVLSALGWTASHARELLDTTHQLARRAVAKARTEGPAAYVVDADRRRGQVQNLLDLLVLKGVEVHRTTRAATIEESWPPATKKKEEDKDKEKGAKKETGPKKIEVAAGSFVIRMDQPYSRLADMLLDTQFYRTDDPRPYDDTGWTLGYAKNVNVRRIVNPAILDVAMEPVTDFAPKPSSSKGPTAVIAEGDIDLYRWLWSAKTDVRIADAPFKAGDKEIARGSVLLEQSADLPSSLRTVSLAKAPDVATRPAKLPRIALLHTWYRTQDEGWYRLALESLGIPYTYLSTQQVARMPDLRAQYDAILFPPCGCDVDNIVWGLPPGEPIPWKRTDLTPNLGGVDETDDIRPGLGLEGIANLRRFVSDGGTLVTVEDTTQLAIQYGLARWVEVKETSKLKAPGTLLKAEVADATSPIAYGYDATVPVYYAGGPVMRVGLFHDPDEPRQRPTGRGGKDDPDVPQGRTFVETPVGPDLPPQEEGWIPVDRDIGPSLLRVQPPVDQRPRVVLRYAKKASDLWLSGMLGGGEEIAGQAAVVDAPLGRGHVVLFGINPMWRQQTQGTFALVLNALLHGEALSTGWGTEEGP
ncbi:MAG TPA: M14 family zinc carboxypeptidase [Candidatus Polarisedimenticolaceae bacterium]|nr:M14 family zinc carboxypeptidase [Candidatus Polarisedimenticolaceae bacterium]